MLTVIMDLTSRCHRDTFFTKNKSLLKELVLFVIDIVHRLPRRVTLHLLSHKNALPMDVHTFFTTMMDGSPTVSMLPEKDWREILDYMQKKKCIRTG